MSYATTGHYETVYILKSGIQETTLTTIHQKVDAVIQKFQGKLVNRDDWGNKDLGYNIHNQGTGHYFVVEYTGNSGVVEEIERHFKILDDVLRFLTVQVEQSYDYNKIKKQIHMAEEELKRMREQRKKGLQM